jgi:RluA family pseudouridine synthase
MSDSKTIIEKIIVEDAAGERLSDYGVGRFESLPSGKSVKKAIKRGLILVNDQVSTTAHRVRLGEEIVVIADDTRRPEYARQLSILFEDEYMAAVQKPADLPVSGNFFRTVQNALAFNLALSNQPDAMAVPRPVHRLDRLTGGVLLIAKTRKAAAHLGNQFEERKVKKTYSAWVAGGVDGKMVLRAAIEGKEAVTDIIPLKTIHHKFYGEITFVKAMPQTGRRNQIRIHLAEADRPILGDLKFGGPKSGRGLFLFAESIEFIHPQSEDEMKVNAIRPKKFNFS